MMYSIIELGDGQYLASCQIQDGVERSTEPTHESAVQWIVTTAREMNGVKIDYTDIHFEKPIPHHHISEESEMPILDATLALVRKEFLSATQKFGRFASTHEGYAIIKEEVDELWDAIKNNRLRLELQEECIQVAAMAVRFYYDLLCDEKGKVVSDAWGTCPVCNEKMAVVRPGKALCVTTGCPNAMKDRG